MGHIHNAPNAEKIVSLRSRDPRLSLIVGDNVRRLRRQSGYSLEQLSHISGVSRAMLGQIETGKSAPTINLLGQIAQALGVSIANLVTSAVQGPSSTILTKDAATILTRSDGRFRARAILPWGGDDKFNIYDVTLDPKHAETFAAPTRPMRRVLVATSGAIDVAIGPDETVQLGEGDAILLTSDSEHTFSNPGRQLARAFLVVAPVDAGPIRHR
ncbi:MAG: helix-turn-helix domain-containing protein [Hyphomicrobium sp.]